MKQYSISELHHPKSGNNTKDYEDAFCYPEKNLFLFGWEEFTENDNARLTDFLTSNYDVGWLKTAKIAKTVNAKTIKLTDGKNVISLNLYNENTELNIIVDNDKTGKFIVKNEKGKLNIYENNLDEIQSLPVAIADGATETSFAVEWAEKLVNSYVSKPFKNLDEFKNRIQSLSKSWEKTVFSKPLPWYAEEKARMGAFSTFIGLEINFIDSLLSKSGQWNAIAIGDSCLFQIRKNTLLSVFPIKKAEDFTNSPMLISSNLENNIQCWDKVLNQSGEWEKDDVFFIISDALAAWFLCQYEGGNQPWDELLKFSEDNKCDGNFEQWIEEKRKTLELKNDDVTCLIIKL